MAGIDAESNECLFRGIMISKNKPGSRLRRSGKMLYSRVRETNLVRSVLMHTDDYGLHSLYASGTTASGVSDRAFKHHGRCK